MLFIAAFAWSHPHVFADVKVQAVFDESGLVGIQNHWEYDEIYGSAMFAAADEDGNGVLSESETGLLKSVILDPMEKDNYRNYLLYKTEFLKAESVENFQGTLRNGKLVLDFLVRFKIPVTADYTFFVFVVTDPTNYILIKSDMENSDVSAPDNLNVEFYNDVLEGLTMMRAFRSDVEGLFVRFKK